MLSLIRGMLGNHVKKITLKSELSDKKYNYTYIQIKIVIVEI